MAETSSGRVTRKLFGADVDALTMDESVVRVLELLRGERPVQHCSLNAAKVVMMRDDPALREIVARCEMVNADGQSVVWASRVLGAPLPERVAGIDLFWRLLGLAETEGLSVYLLGARRDVVDRTAAEVSARFPRLKLAGHRDGYFGPDEDDAVVDEVRSTAADILFVGIPSPRKEYWLAERLDRLGVRFAMGVGGTFDVVAGVTRRAPVWMRRAGLEWLYRLVQEPGRMWRRYAVGNSRFVALVVRERLRRR